MKAGPTDYPVIAFRSRRLFRRWLARHHQTEPGLWLRFYKKDSGRETVTRSEAIDEALCFGWIDGQLRAGDAISWIQKFTPRRPRSVWSKINTQRAERLIESGVMMPAGRKIIDEAKADGRWKSAYVSAREASLPDDFLQALRRNRKAHAFFKTLNRANLYAVVYRLQTAKRPETRARRMLAILTRLEAGRAFHPARKAGHS